jgi:hypothetical protein
MLYGGRIIVWAPPEELKSIDDERLQAFISRGQQEARAGH